MLPGLQTRLLEEKGDDVDPFWDGYTPLMVYAANNEKEKVEEICRDPNNAEYVNTIAGWNNSTALHMAVRNGHFDIMK
jgi:ankyrin repeat protein